MDVKEAIKTLMRPCPCCGCDKFTISEYDRNDSVPTDSQLEYDYMIGCEGCGLHTDYDSMPVVLGVWNTRVKV